MPSKPAECSQKFELEIIYKNQTYHSISSCQPLKSASYCSPMQNNTVKSSPEYPLPSSLDRKPFYAVLLLFLPNPKGSYSLALSGRLVATYRFSEMIWPQWASGRLP